MVEQKGLGGNGEVEWLLLDAAEELRSWGHPEGVSLILKCDNEPAIQQVRDAMGRYMGGTITPEGPPAGESQANGRVGEAGKSAGWRPVWVSRKTRVLSCNGWPGVPPWRID